MKHIVRDICLLAAIALAAASELDGEPSRHRRIAGGTFEASGVVGVPGTNGVLFVDDGEARKVFWMELSGDGAQKGVAVEVPLPAVSVVDLEGITTDGTYFYAVGSQSKTVGFEGDGLIRFTFDPRTRQAGHVESIRALKDFLGKNVAELRGVERRVGDEALNIEGLAWDPAHSRLLLGLRAPIAGTDTLIVPLQLRDSRGSFTAANLKVHDSGAIRLPLGSAGLRSIEFDRATNSFSLITGAPLDTENVEFRLLEWNGGTGTASIREVERYSKKLKPEGITRATIAGRETTVIVFDTGLYEVR